MFSEASAVPAYFYVVSCLGEQWLRVCNKVTWSRYVQDTWCSLSCWFINVQRNFTWDISHSRLCSCLCNAAHLQCVCFGVFVEIVLNFHNLEFHLLFLPLEISFISVCESLLGVQYQCRFSWSCWGWQWVCFVSSQWQGEDRLWDLRLCCLCLMQIHLDHSKAPFFATHTY